MFRNIYNLIHQATQMPDKADLNLNKQNQSTCKFKNSPLKHNESKNSKTVYNHYEIIRALQLKMTIKLSINFKLKL